MVEKQSNVDIFWFLIEVEEGVHDKTVQRLPKQTDKSTQNMKCYF